ncbi:MAG TPA: cobalamin B12-binding domain-containing protein, partial [bacterium]|nr:cobalamin B12-binding domain-containing protein [bacterium]
MGSRKFLLIKPRYAYYPMGLAYVASTLERNHFDYDYVDSFHQELDLENRLRHGNYYAVGSGGLVADYFFLEDLFRRVKQIDKNIPCILGGHIARDVSHELFFRQSPIDFAVIGEAEITLPILLNKILECSDDFTDLKGIIYRSENGEPVKNPPQQRIDLRVHRVFPSFEFFDHSTWPTARLPIPIITGRGCTGKCT